YVRVRIHLSSIPPSSFSFSFILRLPPISTLFPYTTLFRSDQLLVPNFQASFRIDSLVPGFQLVTYYLTDVIGSTTTHISFGPDGVLGAENGTLTFGPLSAVFPADTVLAKQVGLGPLPLAAQGSAELVVGPV